MNETERTRREWAFNWFTSLRVILLLSAVSLWCLTISKSDWVIGLNAFAVSSVTIWLWTGGRDVDA